jgi:hypothetical protein
MEISREISRESADAKMTIIQIDDNFESSKNDSVASFGSGSILVGPFGILS